ncbi:MAG: hypothetical protein KF727_06110 [Microbacteriaceae bacterium]|nr:hypothetical protein [Microbacteriaceae bacterium]
MTPAPAREPADRATVITLGVAAVFAAGVAFAVAFITSFTHRELPPWGLLGGIAVVLALVAAFRLVFDSRVIAAAGVVGVVAAIALLMLPGAGGSLVVLDDAFGWVWALVPTLGGATIAAWPRRRMES